MKSVISRLLLCASSVLIIAGFTSLDKTYFLLLSASFCFFTIFFLSARFGALPFLKLTNSFLFVAFSVMNLLFFVSNYFTGEGINFDVLVHLGPESLQAGLYTIENYHLVTLVLLVQFVLIYIFNVVPDKPTPLSLRKTPFTLIVILMFTLHPFTVSSALLYQKLHSSEYSDLVFTTIDKNYHSDAEIEGIKAELGEQPNVLMIYLESLERTYFDERYYTNLLTEMEKLTTQGIDFDNVIMPWGATNTISGMISSLCGVPITTPTGRKHQSWNESLVYMPRAQCLGDITKKLGYRNLFYQGARLNFASKGPFLQAHGYDEVKGFYELKPKDSESRPASGPWGLHDSFLIEEVENRLEELFSKDTDRPFFFTMLTLDTHEAFHEHGVSSWCTEQKLDKYELADHKVQHRVYCSDKLMGQFISKVLDKWGDKLTVVILSDHGAFHFNVGQILKDAHNKNHRRLLFTIIDKKGAAEKITRRMSTLDLGATVLGYITKNKLNSIGLGLSGFELENENLAEELGAAGLNAALQGSNISLGKKLWEMASLAESDLNINTIEETVQIDSLVYKMPVALMLDSKGRIIDYYGKSAHTKLALNKTSPRIVWVGECGHINGLFQTSGQQEDICLTAGHLGNTAHFSKIIQGSYDVNYDDLVKFLNPEDEKIDTKLINKKLYGNLPENTEIDNLVIQPSADLGRFSIIDFYSTMTIKANLVDYTSPDSLDESLNRHDLRERVNRAPANKYGYPNDNGFYLLSLENGVVDVVFHWKTCGKSQTYPNINEVIKRHRGAGSYVLASARKVRCDQDNISSIFEDSPFSSAAKLKKHQPYIAYWKKGMDSAVTVTSLPNEDVQFRLVDSDLYHKF